MNTMTQLYTKNGELFAIPKDYAEKLIITSGLRFYSTQCNAIPSTIVDKYFEIYSLLYWKGQYVLDNIVAGTITKYSIAFKVQYGKPLCRGSILYNPESQYSLSFRAPNPEWNLPAIVIINEA